LRPLTRTRSPLTASRLSQTATTALKALTLTVMATGFIATPGSYAAAPPAPTAVAPQSTPAASTDAPADLNSIFADLDALTKEFYPSAKISKSDGRIHFEYRALNQLGAHTKTVAPTPLPGGIIGDVAVLPGAYEGADKNFLPSDVIDGAQSQLLMAPFSRQRNMHLLAKLVYPTDVQAEFKERFKSIVKSFNAGETAATSGKSSGYIPIPTAVLTKESPDIIYKNISAVVKQYFPGAVVTLKGNNMHIEKRVRKQFEYYTRKLELAPDPGGILGDVALTPGEYKGADKQVLPSETFQGFRTTLTMAPYSKQLNMHMYVKIICPVDTPNDFKLKIRSMVNSFNAGE
jgi:hypothetical protein